MDDDCSDLIDLDPEQHEYRFTAIRKIGANEKAIASFVNVEDAISFCKTRHNGVVWLVNDTGRLIWSHADDEARRARRRIEDAAKSEENMAAARVVDNTETVDLDEVGE